MASDYLVDLCRVCMGNREKDQPEYAIFEEGLPERLVTSVYEENEILSVFNGDWRLCDVLQAIADLEVAPDDGLPAIVCDPCARRLIDAYLLRIRVEQTHSVLLQLLRDKQRGESVRESDIAADDGADNHMTGETNAGAAANIIEADDVEYDEYIIPNSKPARRGKNVKQNVDCIEPPTKRTRTTTTTDEEDVVADETSNAVHNLSARSGQTAVSSVCTSFEINFIDTSSSVVEDSIKDVHIIDRETADEPAEDASISVNYLESIDEEHIDDDEDDAVQFLISNFAIETPTTTTSLVPESMTGTTTAPPQKLREKRIGVVRRKKSVQQPNADNNSAAAGDDVLQLSRKHRCNVCGKMFRRSSNLSDHLRLHSNVRPYECEICKQRFVQSGNLRAHMRVHTKERPYRCAVCGKTYNQSGALKVHMRTHTNERNYMCSVCEKAFTNSSDRNKHERVHDASLHIKCELCDKKFAQRVNYALHVKKHHLHKKEQEEDDGARSAAEALLEKMPIKKRVTT